MKKIFFIIIILILSISTGFCDNFKNFQPSQNVTISKYNGFPIHDFKPKITNYESNNLKQEKASYDDLFDNYRIERREKNLYQQHPTRKMITPKNKLNYQDDDAYNYIDRTRTRNQNKINYFKSKDKSFTASENYQRNHFY